jgi:hypothetical protein
VGAVTVEIEGAGTRRQLTKHPRYGIIVFEIHISSGEMKPCSERWVAALKQDYRVAAVDKCLDILEFLSRQRREM